MNAPFTPPNNRPQIGISQCLLGDRVRYDSGHKRSEVCTELLAGFVDFLPVCPEMAIGLGTPREPIHLEAAGDGKSVRVVGKRENRIDVTEALEGFSRQKSGELGHLSGYVFMGRSPSCGLGGIKVYTDKGMPTAQSSAGIFAREFVARHPLIPVEEEGRLRDARLRENFVTRVYAWQRWQRLQAAGITRASLQDFHACHKYLLLSHNQPAYRALGRIVALAHLRPLEAAAADYISLFMQTLKTVATNKNHSNVLTHIMGYFKHLLDSDSKQELVRLIHEFRLGKVPLIAPLTLLKHHLRVYPNAYLARQVYFEPHPPELLLRNFY